MSIDTWILQVKGKGPEQRFQLEPAIDESLRRDRTLWLTPAKIICFSGPDHPVQGDRVYLNVAGEKVEGSSRVGKLVAVATVLNEPISHAMDDWQKEYSCQPDGNISDNKVRIHLHIDALIRPALGREEVCKAEPAVKEWSCFYQLSETGRNVHQGTTFFVDKALADVLAALCERRPKTSGPP